MRTNIRKIKYTTPGRLFVLLLLTVAMVSCNKYLDVQPKGVRLLETVNDYDLWLNNYALEASAPRELNLLLDLSDNILFSNPPVDNDGRIYNWENQFNPAVTGNAPIWSNYYQSIYLFNAVIAGIDAAKNGTELQKSTLKSEALLGRAYEYLSLVNLYGKVYNPATAGTDLAVPFVTQVDVTDELPNRNTVKEIYEHIIEDITQALAGLPADNANNRYRGSRPAAYSVLARTYLYMGNYQKAAENAKLAVGDGPNTIIDYAPLADYAQLPNLIRRPGEIYARQSVTYYLQESPSINLLRSYDKKDLRLRDFYDFRGDVNFTERGKTIYYPYGQLIGNAYPNWGTSAAEMRLIIAEAAARSNDLPAAVEQLDLLRKKRFRPADYVKFESSNQETVLQKVLDERTFEMPFNGLRWFDMRRLAAEGKMPEVVRYDATGVKMASLPANSTKYTLQIPVQVMYFNPNWVQNP
jgi:tetratricopeptide (TPR) repeat protein